MSRLHRLARQRTIAVAGSPRFEGFHMTVNHLTSTLVASAFALALGGFVAAPAMAESSGMPMPAF